MSSEVGFESFSVKGSALRFHLSRFSGTCFCSFAFIAGAAANQQGNRVFCGTLFLFWLYLPAAAS
ncbi:MAG: hypothetical protein GX424_05990 [Clostridiales bacterium]|nr:hypothetical protein [Clostridiales bacterium]